MKLDRQVYENTAREAVAEGCVLLKNEKNVLPLATGAKVAVFGRCQNFYYKSGTGSGGMVNAKKVWGILESLKQEDIVLNERLLALYEKFDEEHPYNYGIGFGSEPWSQEEMPVSKELANEIATASDIALIIIGRTAGEEQDYANAGGSYKLTDIEVDMIKSVRSAFEKVVVVLNVPALIDMTDLTKISPDAIIYVWQGGEVGGLGTVDVLIGRRNPSGKLTDTIPVSIELSPAAPYFGSLEYNCYSEDVYLGYRYFETFKPEDVLYPFGFGLSYTSFEMSDYKLSGDLSACEASAVTISVKVTNTGDKPGKEVVQVYAKAPQGMLGKPAKVLAGFAKTEILEPGASQIVEISIPAYTIASYDDSGKTGCRYAYVLESGTYEFYVGNSVRNVNIAGTVLVESLIVVSQLSEQMAPVKNFKRMLPGRQLDDGTYELLFEDTPLASKDDKKLASEDVPAFLPYTGDKGIKLVDVRDGKASMDEFLAQLDEDDLAAIVRGEGMGSPKVTAGTAAAFGGVSPALKEFGIPCGCCSDGPSGMRLDCGTIAFSLPSGNTLASTWNVPLNQKLYSNLGVEMTKNHVDVLLGPGMNIHRFPLNGRNFEYFSEDPLITGSMAAAQIRGMKEGGVTGTLKHFCGNNQETNRHNIDSVVSERALREIYLKGFEIAVREGGADSVMTTYGAVNGIWTNGRHDLNTCILRDEWGFKGIVMTDWWANIGDWGSPSKNDYARMVLAQNDFYAVCPEAAVNSTGDNIKEELESGNLSRGHLTRCASNICSFLMETNAMKRFVGEEIEIEAVGFENDADDVDSTDVPYYEIKDGVSIDLQNQKTDRGTFFVFGVDVAKRGCYFIDLVGSSELSELAQIPVMVSFQSVPGGSFTFNGTAGEWKTIRKKILFNAKYGILRFYFGGSGVKLKEVKFTFEKEFDPSIPWGGYSDYIYG